MANLHVESIQTATPARPAEPGRARRVVAAGGAPRAEALQGHVRLVLYYGRGGEGDEALQVAAWMKETLNEALPGEALLGGRLRREREAEGWWEVRHNDAGVRLVQATAETSMAELLAAKDREAREAALAYWVDINHDNPQFSSLFNVQVTKFEGDGYSIGISCSLLLADPLYLTRFLKKWAATHTRMVAQAHPSYIPIFHLSFFTTPGRPTYLSSTPLDPTPTAASAAAATVLFKVPRARAGSPPALDALASLCIGEAVRRLGSEPVSKFSLIVNDHAGDLKLDTLVVTERATSGIDAAFDVAWWDELGVEEIAFGEGNKPVHVSYRVVPGAADEGLVVVSLPPDDGDAGSDLMISATVPKKI